jgi:cytochrome c2
MIYPGIVSVDDRADLIAYLLEATAGEPADIVGVTR